MFKKIILGVNWVRYIVSFVLFSLFLTSQASAVQIEVIANKIQVDEGGKVTLTISFTQEYEDTIDSFTGSITDGCSLDLQLTYNGEATFGEDYSSTLTTQDISYYALFNDNASRTDSFTYNITSDDGLENDEAFTISLVKTVGNCNVNGFSILETQEITIKDTEPKEELTATLTSTQTEVNEGAGEVEVAKVGFSPSNILGDQCNATAQVSITSSGSAIEDKDFSFTDGQTLNFGANQKDPQAISLNILTNNDSNDDTTVELKAIYTIENDQACKLKGGSPVEITKMITIKATPDITPEKITATFNQEQSNFIEGSGPVTIGSVNFSRDSSNAQNAGCSVSAKINVLGGTAILGTDFVLLSDTDIIFNANDDNLVSPIKIDVKEGIAGGAETVVNLEAIFSLSPGSAAVCELTSPPTQQFSVTITDDPYDTSKIELQALTNNSVAQEGETIQIKLALRSSRLLSARALGTCEMSADWNSNTSGSARKNEDYIFNPPSVISFSGSDPIQIPLEIVKDSISEDKEDLNIKVVIKGTGNGPCATIPETTVALAALTLVDADLRKRNCAIFDNKKAAGTLTGEEESFHTSNCANDSETIRNFEAEEIATQTDAVLGAAERQLRNVRSRLDKLRSTNGQRGVDISGTNLKIQGTSIPVGLFGGAAGDDDENELLANSRWGLFVNGEYAFGEKNHDEDKVPGSGDRSFDFNSKGLTVGADYRFPGEKMIAGGAIGYKDFDSDYTTQDGFTNTKGATLSLYGTYLLSEKSYLDAIVGFGKDQIDSRRPVNNDGSGGDISTFAIGKPDANEYTFSVGGGYDIRSNEWTFTPYGRLDYTKGTIDAYSETASHSSASTSLFRINRQDVEALTSALGVKASRVYSSSKGVFIPHVTLEWKHELKERDTISGKSIFLNEDFEVDNRTDIDKDYYNISLGVSAVFPKGRSAYLNLESRLGDSHVDENAIKAGFRWEF